APCRVRPGIACPSPPPVVLVDDPDAAVLCRCGIAQGRAFVRSSHSEPVTPWRRAHSNTA
ncbi:hypothetical protein ACSTB0_13470, partial [Faecalibacterium wellingii]|uniref:hypothetical protein n=1 Tax=Faecalibacterium wellingii TaxID=2929491 RepID=UPI003EDB61A3